MTTNTLTEQDRQSIALSGRAQEKYLRSFNWAVDRVLGPGRPMAPTSDQHLDRVLLNCPWELDGQSDVSTKTRVIDCKGKIVALITDEDVAELIVHLVNQIPAGQATTL